MDKVRFEISGSLGLLTLTNPPLNLFSGEVIEDLRAVVDHIQRDSTPSAAGAGRRQNLFGRGRCQHFSGQDPLAKRASVSPAICG